MIDVTSKVAAFLKNNEAKLNGKDMPEDFITKGLTLCEELTALNKTQEILKGFEPE